MSLSELCLALVSNYPTFRQHDYPLKLELMWTRFLHFVAVLPCTEGQAVKQIIPLTHVATCTPVVVRTVSATCPRQNDEGPGRGGGVNVQMHLLHSHLYAYNACMYVCMYVPCIYEYVCNCGFPCTDIHVERPTLTRSLLGICRHT